MFGGYLPAKRIDKEKTREGKMIVDKLREIKDNVTEYTIGKKRIYLLSAGRLVNLAAAEGHPAGA